MLTKREEMSHRSIILATASYDNTIRLWEPQSGQCYKTIPYPDLHVNKIEITPDKCKLAAACNPNIQLFDLNSNYPHTPERTFRAESWKSNNVMAVGFSNNGNIMYSGSEDGKIKIWDLRSPECQKVYGKVSDSRNKFKIGSSSQKNDQNVWSCHQKEYRSGSAVNTVVLHPNQVSISYVPPLCVRDIVDADAKDFVILRHVTELISGDQDGSIRLWDMRANSCRYELVPEIDTPISSLSVMSDGTMMVAANNNGTCFVWNCISGTHTEFKPLQKIQAHNGYILKCLLSPQNKYLATASSDKTVKIWNVDGFKLEKVFRGHQRYVWGCNFSVDGEFLLTASSDMTAKLWSMQTENEVMVFRGHQKAIVSCTLRD